MRAPRSGTRPVSGELLALAALTLAAAACDSSSVLEPRSTLLRPGSSVSASAAPTVSKVILISDSGVDKKTYSVTVGKKAYFSALVYDASGKLIAASAGVQTKFKTNQPKLL